MILYTIVAVMKNRGTIKRGLVEELCIDFNKDKSQ
jgi:hypothetical protein